MRPAGAGGRHLVPRRPLLPLLRRLRLWRRRKRPRRPGELLSRALPATETAADMKGA